MIIDKMLCKWRAKSFIASDKLNKNIFFALNAILSIDAKFKCKIIILAVIWKHFFFIIIPILQEKAALKGIFIL